MPASSLGRWNPSSRVAWLVLNETDTPPDVHYNFVYRDDSHPVTQDPVFVSVKIEQNIEEIQPISEEIKVEKVDDNVNINIRDNSQNAEFIVNIQDIDIEKSAVGIKSENAVDKSMNIYEEHGKSSDGKFANGRQIVGDDDVICVGDDESLDDEIRMSEEFLKSVEEMDFDAIESDEENDLVKKKGKHKGYDYDVGSIKFNLEKKLANIDQIVAKDGTLIDKEWVLSSLREGCPSRDLRSLQYACKSRANKLIRVIQSFYQRYQEDEKYKSVFNIQYLNTYEMKVEEFEQRKTYDCYVNARYKCDICYTPQKNAKELEYHIKDHHEERPENAGQCCPICKVRPGKRLITANTHSATHNAVYKCKRCPVVTYYRFTMQSHYAMHEGKKLSCDQCSATFKWRTCYFKHMSKYHGRKQYECTTCGRGFTSSHALVLHAKIHQDEPALPPEAIELVPCRKCAVTFPSQAVYAAHVQDVHTAPRAPRPSPADSVSLPQPRTNLRTIKASKRQRPKRQIKCKLLHSAKKKHKCVFCGKVFQQPSIMYQHMRCVHRKVRGKRALTSRDTKPRGKERNDELDHRIITSTT